jgi:hypothetical protein
VSADQIIAPGLLPQPEKPLSVQVTALRSQVVLHLSQPREFVALSNVEPVIIGTQMLCRAIEADGANAVTVIDLCMAVIDFAYELRGDLKPAGGAVKHELIERHRRTLTKRLEVVMNSTREKKTVSNAQLAKEAVEICLKEVFA